MKRDRLLTSDEDATVDDLLDRSKAKGESGEKKISEIHDQRVTRSDAQCLRPGVWLNGNTINTYLELLKAHNYIHRQQNSGDSGDGGGGGGGEQGGNTSALPKCYFMNTDFYAKLSKSARGYDYSAVKRWTRNTTLFEYDLVFVPIHVHGNHWCLVTIDFQQCEMR